MIRIAILAVLWLLTVGYVLKHAVINFFTIFAIAASGILVFVPLFRKYNK